MTQINAPLTDSFAFKTKAHLIELSSAILGLCDTPPGLSKQDGVQFERQRSAGGQGLESVEQLRSALSSLLKVLLDALGDEELLNVSLTGPYTAAIYFESMLRHPFHSCNLTRELAAGNPVKPEWVFQRRRVCVGPSQEVGSP